MAEVSLQQFDGYPDDGLVYLVAELSHHGFFMICNGCITYAVPHRPETKASSSALKTDYISLFLGVELRPILDKKAVGEPRTLDFIQIIKDANDREKLAFIDMCSAYEESNQDQDLRDFFNTLYSLFSTTPEESRKNAVGLFGELSLIQDFAAHEVDLSQGWQLDGLRTKYDFSIQGVNIEVKTTTAREHLVRIKHEQLFNGDANYLVFTQIEENPSGDTLRELIERLKNNVWCFNGMRERMLLEKSILAVRDEELDRSYSVFERAIFSAIDLNPFSSDLPERVSRVEYILDVVGIPSLDTDYFFRLLDSRSE